MTKKRSVERSSSIRFERRDAWSCDSSESTTSGCPYVRTPETNLPGDDDISACDQTITASRFTGVGRPSIGSLRTDFDPISSGLSWRKRAPFAEMSQIATLAFPNVAAIGGASRKRSAVRRFRAASYMLSPFSLLALALAVQMV